MSFPFKLSGHRPLRILYIIIALSNLIKLETESQLQVHPSFNLELSASVLYFEDAGDDKVLYFINCPTTHHCIANDSRAAPYTLGLVSTAEVCFLISAGTRAQFLFYL